jgi:methyl-accepting chemotaxis protein
MKSISLKWILVGIIILMISIPVISLGTISYNTSKQATFSQIEDILKQQAQQVALYVNEVDEIIEVTQEGVEKQAKSISSEQAKVVYELIQSGNSAEEIKSALSKIVIGKTGYIWIVDYDGNYVLSKDRARDGENIYGAKDSNGVYFIQEAIAKAKKLTGNQIDYQIYPWQNAGEDKARTKIAALLHIPQRGWVVGVGTYYDEFVETGVDHLQEMKEKIAEMVVGKTGYIYILDSDGNYILSQNMARDGENIWDAKDSDGNYFIQEIVKKAHNLKDGEADIQYYPWKNTGENSARMKLAGVSYVPDADYIIGVSAYQEDFLDGLKQIQNVTLIVAIISIVLGSILAYLFAQMIAKQMAAIIEVVKVVASGDLRNEAKIKTSITEMNVFVESFNKMIRSVSGLISKVIASADMAASSAEELSASSEEVNASVQQVSSTIQEIAKGAQNLSKNANDVSEKSKKTEGSANTGAKSAESVKDKMSSISETTKAGAEQVRSLGEKSEKIGQIVETINNISEQTNLLALNAAIEAARAGDAGRGFAVVADEVRKLAEETGKATNTISELITNIQSEIGNSVQTMDENTRQVDEGVDAVNEALMAFQAIPTLVQDVNSSISEISSVAEENAAGSEEVSSSIEEVTSSMQQVSSAAQTLSKNADDLRNIVMQFKISNSSYSTVSEQPKKDFKKSDDKSNKTELPKELLE